MNTITLVKADLASLLVNVPTDVDVVLSDPSFGIGGDERLEKMYHRKKEELVGGYEETVSPATFYANLVTYAGIALRQGGLALFVSGWSHYHDLRNAVECSSLVMLNELVFPYTFGVYAPRKFVTSHYLGALLEKGQGKGRVVRHHKSANLGKPYSADVIPFRRLYRRGTPRYVNTLSPDLTKKLAWHLVPEDAKVLDLCCGMGGFAQGILLCDEVKQFQYTGIDCNEKVLLLAETVLAESAKKHGKEVAFRREGW